MTINSQRLLIVDPPPHLSLFTLQLHVGWTVGGSRDRVNVCRFRMGISRNVRKDESLVVSFSLLSFVCFFIGLSLGENTQEDGDK